jgi:hypothetical protein
VERPAASRLRALVRRHRLGPVQPGAVHRLPFATRGRSLLDQIVKLLRHYGYIVAETTHDCGELGGLGQSRKRFLLVARHAAKVPPFLYEPPKRRLRGVGEILDLLPLPGDLVTAGPMRRMPSLQWKTWVRLAFVEAGSDWRSLNKLNIAKGVLTDFGIMPEHGLRSAALGVLPWTEPSGAVIGESFPTNGRFAVADPRATDVWNSDVLGVRDWGEPSGTVPGRSSPTNGAFSVADPRYHNAHPKAVHHGVRPWDQPAAVVKGDVSVGTGPYAVADPRMGDRPLFNNIFRVVPFDQPSPAVAGPGGAAGGLCVADPRPAEHASYQQVKYRVTRTDEPAGAVIAASTTGNGAFAVADPRRTWGPDSHTNKLAVTPYEDPSKAITGSDRVGSGALCVADPRPDFAKDGREVYLTQGHYGVKAWDESSRAVTASGQHDNGSWSVADPREGQFAENANCLPVADDRLVAVIRSMDGTWHRPFTTLELAALQSLYRPRGHARTRRPVATAPGGSGSATRCPRPRRQAIASEMGKHAAPGLGRARPSSLSRTTRSGSSRTSACRSRWPSTSPTWRPSDDD